MKNLIVFSFLFLSYFVIAQDKVERQNHFNLEDKVAIEGYDPVAYFSDKAVEGHKKFAAEYKGVTYYFSSENNKNTFLENPSKYEPQYGGWCAYAMGENGEKVGINPKTYKIIDGKLYLFYNAYFTNTLKSWNKDEDKLKPKADEYWNELLNSK